MDPALSPSLQGLLLQAIGIAQFALLSFLLGRSIRRDYLRYWWPAWASLTLALFALFCALRLPASQPYLEPLYYFGEYVFGGLLVAGCRSLARGRPLESPRAPLLLLPAAALALALPRLHPSFTVRFIPQAGVMAVLFVLALRELRGVPRAGGDGLGRPLLEVSLLALALSFVHYVPVLWWSAASGHQLPASYSSYTSLFDLLFETLLGFGTVIAVMEGEQRELELVNEELRTARAQLELRARVDPLTSSLNRHAFYSMVEGGRSAQAVAGCVAVADLDALKPINDTFGHAAGDAAIRAVARAIREVVRADDLVFRWGGDEFLVVLFGVPEEEARRRLDTLDQRLTAVRVPGSAEPLAIGVSTGVAAFDSLAGLEAAQESADERMYRRKAAKRVGLPVSRT